MFIKFKVDNLACVQYKMKVHGKFKIDVQALMDMVVLIEFNGDLPR